MSIRETKKRRVVRIPEMHCDGPKHKGETFMQCDTITVSHGFGSPYDMDTHHFCCLACLQDWAAQDHSNGGK